MNSSTLPEQVFESVKYFVSLHRIHSDRASRVQVLQPLMHATIISYFALK